MQLRAIIICSFSALCALGGALATPVDRTGKVPHHELTTEEKSALRQKHGKAVQLTRELSKGYPDSKVGRRVSKWKKGGVGNVEELGSYFQGDILHVPKKGRQGIIDTAYRWPNAVIPYYIRGRFTTAQRNMILNAMAAFQNTTCLRFRPYIASDRDFVSIESGKSGCWSNLGRMGGYQQVNLQVPGCVTYVGTVIHELMHAAGFFHKQSRTDRDNFVIIHPENIEAGMGYNFDKIDSATFNIPYEYESVMHYSSTAFSKNGLPTITATQSGAVMGQRFRLTSLDSANINAMYNCNIPTQFAPKKL